MDKATKTRYRAELGEAIAQYNQEKQRAVQIERDAIARLVAKIEEAHAAGEGLKKSEILKSMNHELSRSWLDRVLPAKKSEGTNGD